jgi:hypothetical protein
VKLLLAFLVLVLVACSQSGVAPATGLSGTNSSAVSGSLLFVTSTRSNELRVLDLEPRAGQQRDFVRAPNPLRSLSIPTVAAPVELATPTRYGPLGQPLQGDWIFVRGAGGPAVSIIGALNCPQQLREFGQVVPRPDSVVTALASRLTADDRQAQLYLATFDGTDSTLWELILPNLPRDRGSTVVDSRLCGNYPSTLPAYSLQPLGIISSEVVTAMVALPTVQHPAAPPDPEERRLVIATRLLVPPVPLRPGMTERGLIRVVDSQGAGVVTSPFPAVFNPDTTVAESFPVKRMITHGNVVQLALVNQPDGGPPQIDVDGGVTGTASVVMDAGTRIFAVLDEASCGGSLDCVGVLAVDLDRTGTLQQYDGGSITAYPVAIDGFDDGRDFLDGGVPVRFSDGTCCVQFSDTYYRPPAFFDGGVPRDANRMLPIRFGNNHAVGIIQDITVQSSGQALYYTGAQLQYGLLGFVTITGYGGSIPPAQIFAFDAMTLRQINFSPNIPALTAQQAILNSGGQATFRGGPVDIRIDPGIWPYSESVYVLYEGIVAGISGEPLDAGLGDPRDGGWPISINSRTLIEQGFVEAGDIVVPVDNTGTECPFAFPVLDAGPGGTLLVPGPGGVYLVTRKTALSADFDGGTELILSDGTMATIDSCPPPLSYNVRSSGLSAHPLTVIGTSSAYLGRMAVPPTGGVASFAAGENSTPRFVRFWRPTLDAGTSAAVFSPNGLAFNMNDQITYIENGQLVTDAGIEPVLKGGDISAIRGSGYFFAFLNGYTPAAVGISSVSLGLAGLNLPGALALYQRNIFPLPQSIGADRVFILYPAGNIIVDFSPTTVTYSADNVQDIGVHY